MQIFFLNKKTSKNTVFLPGLEKLLEDLTMGLGDRFKLTSS